jgi:signal transduction histidine kinase
MGLGLAISRSMVESHGGQLWAASKEGVGTTVRFTLKVAKEERHDSNEREGRGVNHDDGGIELDRLYR